MFNFPFLSGNFDGKINNDNDASVEPQEVFLDKLSRKKEEETGMSEQKIQTPLSEWTLKIFGLVLFLLLLVILGRSFQMQVIDGDSYGSLANRNKSIIQPTDILRGVIYDQKGDQLVENTVTFDVEINDAEIKDKEEILEFLSETTNTDKKKMEKRLESIDDQSVLLSDISHEAAVIIRSREDDFPFSLQRSIERKYKHGPEFAHILGYTGKVNREEIKENPERYTIHDYIGKTGLEKKYEESLAKDRGSIEIEIDAHGDVKSEKEVDPIEPGNSLKLWTDSELQKSIKENTKVVLEDVGASKASVVALDPETGGVMGMKSIPTYDNNVFSRSGDKELLNQFLTDNEGAFLNRNIGLAYPTGSVIKPILAAAALEEGIIDPRKEIFSPGYLEIPNPWDPTNPTRMRDYQAHGWTDMREALAVSSNVYFYTIGGGHEDQEGLGISKIKKYLQSFGWGEKSGIDLPGERSGFIPDPEWKAEEIGSSWTLGDTYNTSIGQGYLETTPLQVANSYAAIVNGGRLMRPQLVKEVRDGDKIIEKQEPEIINKNLVSSQNLEIVKEGMRMAVTDGTARRLSWLPVEAGAKTGTAQIPREGYYHNWIAAFAPYENPEIVLVVLVEEVEGITSSAARISEKVLQDYFKESNNYE